MEKIAERKLYKVSNGGYYINLPNDWIKTHVDFSKGMPVFGIYVADKTIVIKLERYEKNGQD